jgi:hypothetical protein
MHKGIIFLLALPMLFSLYQSSSQEEKPAIVGGNKYESSEYEKYQQIKNAENERRCHGSVFDVARCN